MTKCKECNEAISISLDEINSGELPMPKQVSKASSKNNMCLDCWTKHIDTLIRVERKQTKRRIQ